MTLSREESRPERYGTDDLRQAVQDALRVGVEAGTGLERRDRWLWAVMGALIAAVIGLGGCVIIQDSELQVLDVEMEHALKEIAIIKDRGERHAMPSLRSEEAAGPAVREGREDE